MEIFSAVWAQAFYDNHYFLRMAVGLFLIYVCLWSIFKSIKLIEQIYIFFKGYNFFIKKKKKDEAL